MTVFQEFVVYTGGTMALGLVFGLCCGWFHQIWLDHRAYAALQVGKQ